MDPSNSIYSKRASLATDSGHLQQNLRHAKHSTPTDKLASALKTGFRRLRRLKRVVLRFEKTGRDFRAYTSSLAHVAEGVVAGPYDDLMLDDAAGLPTGNLAKVMANMAAVEIGPARPAAD